MSVSRLFSLPTHLLRRGSETLLQTSSPAYLLHTSLPEAPQVPTPSRSPSLLRGPRPGNRSSTGPVDQDRHPGVVLGDFSLTQHPSNKAPGGHRVLSVHPHCPAHSIPSPPSWSSAVASPPPTPSTLGLGVLLKCVSTHVSLPCYRAFFRGSPEHPTSSP